MRILQRLALVLLALVVVLAIHFFYPPASIRSIDLSDQSVNTSVDLSQMELVFSDEFEAATLDRDRWVTEYWNGVRTNAGNQEAQYYVPDAFEFMDGILRIRADEKSTAGFDYTSGLISTRESFVFQNGYMELRARVPSGKGLWPAFWLLQPGPWPPEIDVLEVLGDKTDQVHMSLHYQDDQGQASHNMGSYQGADFSKDFHTFAAQWKPTEIIWYIDGVERYRLQDNIPQVPMYLLINLAVGGTWPGYPDTSTPFPSYFDVDYVRVYQSKSMQALGEV